MEAVLEMRLSCVAPVLLAVFIFSVCLHAQAPMPQMKGIAPGNGKAGDLVTVTGENLDKASVAKLYLTDGTNDIEVNIEGQDATTIKFKIPAKAKPGRLALMVLTRGKEPKLIEQPVKVTIDE
jgi:hypothetical protein